MKENDTMHIYMNQVVDSYRRLGSLQKTAEDLGMAYAKIRKILITLGEYETEFSREVAIRRTSGKSVLQIAVEMNTTANRVTAFLPYEKVIYDGPKQTNDSLKSKRYRNRIQVAKKHFITEEVGAMNKIQNVEMKRSILEKERVMENNEMGKKAELTAIRLHIELKNDDLTDDNKRMLQRYGESSTGVTISRDILIPSDMMLHNLHYTIQRLFGWQNSHLRSFILPKDIYQKLTNGTVKGWSDLVGILFQPPGEAEEDVFWDDDYQSGSIKVWLKKKYSGPYYYGGDMEFLDTAQKDVQELLNRFTMIDVKESFQKYWERSKVGENTEMKILRKAPLSELTLEEMNSSICIEGGTENLLERLEVSKVLAAKDEEFATNELFPITKELIYNYDFGDNWIVTITKKKDCEDLIKRNILSEEELIEANEIIIKKHKPVCIHKDGIFLLDDVGGLSGFADFLGTIYESEDKEERTESRAWAQSLGWSTRKVANKLVL